MHALVAGGADVIEVGVPFSDPEADGPAIQKSSERALAAGTRLVDVIDVVAEFRAPTLATPVLLMGYLNSIERMGYPAFVIARRRGHRRHDSGEPAARGSGRTSRLDARARIELIFLVAPTSTPARIRLIAGEASGFIYYVALKGVTGSNALRTDGISEQVARIREHTDLPIMVGFGIKDGATARMIAPFADGVVVGTALVTTMARHNSSRSALPRRCSNNRLRRRSTSL